MHVKGAVGWNQLHILVRLIIREDKVGISEGKVVRLSKAYK